jgi:SP family sugar:H+ symporter-like MFS transporter
MYWVEILPASLFLTSLLFIPESPRYLVAADREDEARGVIQTLSTAQNVDEKIADIRSTLQEGRPSLSDILHRHTGRVHPLVWVGLGLAALQQFTGINVVFYYGATLWQAAGFTESVSLLNNVVTGSVNIAFTFVAIALVDRLGRKPLLLVGALGQAVMLAVLAYAFGTAAVAESGDLQLTSTMGTVALVAANTYVAFFAFSWGPVMWVMLGEMFPNRFRGAALSLAGVVQWLSNFTITMTFPILLDSIGLGLSYGIYAAFGVVAYVFVRQFVVETKGRTLEEISREAMAAS